MSSNVSPPVSRFDFVASLAEIGVWSCDLPFDDLIWNAACKAHFGLPPDARVTIETFYERMHPDDVTPTRAAIDESVKTARPYDVEYRTLQRDGSYRWIRAVGRTEYDQDGVPQRFEGITTDIDGQKQAVAALADSRDRLRAALDASATGTFRWSIDTNELDWDDNLDRLFGLAPGATARSLTEFLNFVHQDDRQRVIDACARCAAENADFCEEFRVVWPDGTVRWLFDKGRVFVSDDGARYMSGACVDVTERRNQEDALRAADRQKDEFLGMLAHELRNPLAPLVYSVDVLHQHLTTPELRHPVDIIGRQAQRMTRIVDDLLDVSRVTQGKIALQRGRLSMASVLSHAVDALRPAMEARRHTLLSGAVDPSLVVIGDEVRVGQIIENLLTNAAKYTPDGGSIKLTAEREGDHVAVSVADTGIGIAADMIDRVFDLFAQADRSLDRAEGGLGIGLTLADRLARLHGGSVTAHSPGLGQGSTFTVRLPLAVSVLEAVPEPAPPAAAGVRVLVVEDNVDSAEMLSLLLKLHGHTVLAVHDGMTAVRASAEFAPDVVLLDIGLPGRDGYEIAQDFRQLPHTARVRIYAMTGYGSDEDRARCLASGFDEHLTKPVDITQLNQLLSRAAATSSSPLQRS